MDWRPISADSHITEPPNCYVENIDPAFRERAPRVVSLDKMGDTYVVEGMKTPVPLGLIAAAVGIFVGGMVIGRTQQRTVSAASALNEETLAAGVGKLG